MPIVIPGPPPGMSARKGPVTMRINSVARTPGGVVEIKRVCDSGMWLDRDSVDMIFGAFWVVGLTLAPGMEALPRCVRNRVMTV